MCRGWAGGPVITCCAIALSAVPGAAAPAEVTSTYPCHAVSLYIWGRLEGVIQETWDEFARDPRVSKDELTCQELMAWAEQLGTRCVALQLRDGSTIPARPAIALLWDRRTGRGHFVVLRPLGGSYVQVIDPDGVIAVWPAERVRGLLRRFEVTLLVRERFTDRLLRRLDRVCAGASVGLILGWLCVRWWRRRR